MSGRKQIPLAVQEARKGRVHISTAEREARLASEFAMTSEEPASPPDFLETAAQVAKFNEIAEMLTSIDPRLCTKLDEDTIGRYVVSQEEFVKYSKMARAEARKKDCDTSELARIQRMESAAFQQAHKCAEALGLTLSSRMRFDLPKKEEPKENKFGKFE